MQCLLFIIRKTYGYGKKEDSISNSQFCKSTGLDKSNICRAISGLIEKRLVVKKDNNKISSYQLNKHYAQWKVLSKKTTVVKSDNPVLSKVTNTKETLTKETSLCTKGEKFDPISYRPENISREYWDAFLANRKHKKLQNTELALKKIVSCLNEAVSRGYTMEDCLEEYISSNMQRFHYSWMDKTRTGNEKNRACGKGVGFAAPGKPGKTDWLNG